MINKYTINSIHRDYNVPLLAKQQLFYNII